MSDPIFEALGLKHVEPLGLGCRQRVRILGALCNHNASSSDSKPYGSNSKPYSSDLKPFGLSATATPWKPPTPLSASATPWVEDAPKPWGKENQPDYTNTKIGIALSGKWLDNGSSETYECTFGKAQSHFRAEAPAFVPDRDASTTQMSRPLSENAKAFVPGLERHNERGRSCFRLNEDAKEFAPPPTRRVSAPRSDSCLVDCSSLCFDLLEEDLSPARTPRCSSRHSSPLVIPYSPSPGRRTISHSDK